MLLIKKSLFLIIICSIFMPLDSFQDTKVEEEIIDCFQTGNSKNLSGYFNQNVELTLLGNKNIYSKAQAKQIMSKFFNEHTPESFKILTSTSENKAQNIIGLLVTKDEIFRVYILFKQNNQKKYIHILKIEKRQN